MLYSFYLIVLMICFFASITVYFQIGTPSYLKTFPFFLLVTILVEVAVIFLKENTWLYNLFSVTEYVFYFAILREIIISPKARRVILFLLWIYPALALFNIFFVQKITHFHSISYALGSLLIVLVCAYYFLELFQLKQAIDLIREPSFWICTGLLFFYSCTFPFFGFANFFGSAPRIFIQNYEKIVVILNILLYLLFTIALLCRIKTRSSMS